MKWVWWGVGTVAFLVMLYFTALPGDLPAADDGGADGGLAGTYTVNGVDPTGNEYSGTVVIRATDDVVRYEVEWIVTGAIQFGEGLVEGRRFTVDWTEVNNATDTGTGPIVYEIQPNGELAGTWFAEGFDEPGTETVFPDA